VTAAIDIDGPGVVYPSTPTERLPAEFNATRLVHELYGSLCPHDADDGCGSIIFNEPAYQCARCMETMVVRAYLIGVAAGRKETKP